MMRRMKLTVACMAVLLLGSFQSSHAAIIQLSGPGDFLSVSPITQDFELPAINTPPMTFDPSAQRFTASVASSGVTTSGAWGLLDFIGDEPLRVDFSADVFEVGLFFGNDDFGLVFDAILEVFDGSNNSLGSVSVTSNANDFVDQFLGLRSDIAIRAAEIRYQRPEAQQLAIFIDDFTVGLDSAAIPEPTTMALWGLGAVGFAVVARRRRKMKTA